MRHEIRKADPDCAQAATAGCRMVMRLRTLGCGFDSSGEQTKDKTTDCDIMMCYEPCLDRVPHAPGHSDVA